MMTLAVQFSIVEHYPKAFSEYPPHKVYCRQFAYFWYIVALSDQLQPNTVLARSLDGEWLAIFRGEDGQAAALRDRPPYVKTHKREVLYCMAALQP
jgi:hypothetical protein